MSFFHYQDHELFAEHVPVKKIANEFGTPTYIYSKAAITKNYQAFAEALKDTPYRICYAVKANSNLAVLNTLARMGSGFDIVSQGELERVLAAGGDPKKIVFSGVGKKANEILHALQIGIHCFNVESMGELERIHTIAKKANLTARIALRINPNIDARTHPYIATGLKENKFGIEFDQALPICRDVVSMPNIRLLGIACHIGSQLTEMSPFLEAMDRILELVDQCKKEGMVFEHINIGGGLGICYKNEEPPSIQQYVNALKEKLKPYPFEIILEPGRAIIANAGILLTQIEYLKHTPYKNFAIVDAAMNDFMRPALYDAWQDILPVTQNTHTKEETYDIVGPVCETADFLGKDRNLSLQQGALLAITCAGAYGFSMSSNYNSRLRAAEVIVDGTHMHLARKRENYADLFANEHLLSE